MVAFSVAHMFTFTYKEYLTEGMEERRRSGVVGWLFEGINKRRRGNACDPTSDGRGGWGRRPATGAVAAIGAAEG